MNRNNYNLFEKNDKSFFITDLPLAIKLIYNIEITNTKFIFKGIDGLGYIYFPILLNLIIKEYDDYYLIIYSNIKLMIYKEIKQWYIKILED